MHGFCLGNMQLMQSLFSYCATWQIFSDNPAIMPAIMAWIVDDLARVAQRKNSLYLTNYIPQLAPKHASVSGQPHED